MMKLNFLFQKKDFSRIKTKNNIWINFFCYENKSTFAIYISDKKFDNSMDLLLIINENKSQYVYTKDFDRLIFHKRKNKNKTIFSKSCLQCFSSKNVLNSDQVVV